ncbi:unnamed protein product [Paramecium primaurelia]|uniref:Transmembrane protein 135 N-terminal domain-containing protein n=1 Tax=Paramecium primaurelia TaxID=5886 RepID=A0A8S1PHF6_PARPR|nr:unnamed protein product [Paramecium primaurelia]
MNDIYSFPVEEQLNYIQGLPYKCEYFHPGFTCETQILHMFPILFSQNAKVYLPVHLLPFLIYKRKAFLKNPISTTIRSLFSYIKSVLFLTLMVQAMRYNWCKQVRFRNTVDPLIPISGGFIGAFSLLLESKSRAQEIMLSIVPRYFETILNLLKRKGWINNIPKGDVFVFAIILAIIHYYYQYDSKALKTTYRGMFGKFWGKN